MKTRNTIKAKRITPGPAARVAIARDVVKQLNSKRYKAMTGVWIGVKRSARISTPIGDIIFASKVADAMPGSSADINGKDDLCSIVTSGSKCEVCALGGIFLSIVRVTGKCRLSNPQMMNMESRIFESLEKSQLTQYFPKKMLRLMESCFEGNLGIHFTTKTKDALVAEAYFHDNKNDLNRLTAIAKNIIRNNGDFIPEQDLKPSSVKGIASLCRDIRSGLLNND